MPRIAMLALVVVNLQTGGLAHHGERHLMPTDENRLIGIGRTFTSVRTAGGVVIIRKQDARDRYLKALVLALLATR